jgi:hypothetical protein
MPKDPVLRGLLLIGLLVHGALAAYAVRTDRPLDYYAYVVAARSFAAGDNAYRATLEGNAARARALHLPTEAPPYLYPTLTALVVTPLSFLPPRVGAGLWALAGVLATWAATLALVRAAPAASRRRRLAFVALVVLFIPILSSLWAGQVNALVLLLLVLALVRLEHHRDASAGVLLALSIGLKPFALAVVPLLVWRRRWRALGGVLFGGALVLALSLVAFGPEATADQFGRVAGVVAPAAPRLEPTVQNLHSLVARAWGDRPAEPGRGLDLAVRGLLAGAAVLVVLRRRGDDALTGEAVLLVTTTLLVSPLTWYHHYVLLLPALAWWTLRTAEAARPALAVPFALLYAASGLHGLAWKGLAALGPAALGFPTLWALLLWAGLALIPLRPSPPGGASNWD